MHVRFSTCIGLPVVEEQSGDVLGTLHGILLHPDTGKVEGFFVRVDGFLRHGEQFLSSVDIERWGMRIHVRSRDHLSDIEERVRLRPLLEGGRFLLGQRMLTEDGSDLGRCQDVQFDTVHFVLEWFWPKKWWRLGMPVAASDIIEVRKDAIIVRSQLRKASEKEGTAILPPVPEAA